MKAIRVHEFGAPEVLKLEEVDMPQPLSGQVLIKVKAAGVNPYDTYMRAGGYGARNPPLPYTPGSDAAGVVESLGADVTDLGTSVVEQVSPLTGSHTPFITGRKTAIDVLPVRENHDTDYLVLQHASAGPFFGSPGLVLLFEY